MKFPIQYFLAVTIPVIFRHSNNFGLAFHSPIEPVGRLQSPSRCLCSPVIFMTSAKQEGTAAVQVLTRNYSSASDVMDIQKIIALLERTYPQTSDIDDATKSKESKQRWTKTRNYLYQYRASILRNSSKTAPEKVDVRKTSKESRSRRRPQKVRAPLTLSQIQSIINFLRATFPDHPHLQSRILQRSPRILSLHGSIESRLEPCVEFLKDLYERMPRLPDLSVGVDGVHKSDERWKKEDWGMFHEAIWRNTDLLLVRGVGYSGDACEGLDDPSDCAPSDVDRYSQSTGKGNIQENYQPKNSVEDYLQNEWNISPSGIAKLKKNHPTLFQLSLKHKLIPAVEYLHSILGPKKQQKQMAKLLTKHPTLFHLDIHTNLKPTVQFLEQTFQLTEEELSNVIMSTPGILGLSVEKNLKPTFELLRNVLEYGGMLHSKSSNDDEIDKSEKGFDNAVKLVQSGDTKEEDVLIELLRKCIVKHPQILALSLNNLRAKVHYFDVVDGVPSLDERRAARKKGSNAFAADGSLLSAKVLLSAPSAYSLSIKDNIIPKVEYLADLWNSPVPKVPLSSITNDDVAYGGAFRATSSSDQSAKCGISMLSDRLKEYPQILTLSLEGNILPTMAFYNMTGYVDLDEHGRPQDRLGVHEKSTSTSNNPEPVTSAIRSRYIATSLYNRLLPRWHFLLEQHQKKQQQLIELQITQQQMSPQEALSNSNNDKVYFPQPPLHLLAGANDGTFCSQMKISLSSYLEWKEEAVPRLKFNSQFARWLKTGRPIDAIGNE